MKKEIKKPEVHHQSFQTGRGLAPGRSIKLNVKSEIMQELILPVSEGRIARVQFPMEKESFNLLMATLNLWERRIVRKPLDSDYEI